MSTASLQSLVDRVRAAGAGAGAAARGGVPGSGLCIRGGGSKDFYGNAPRGELLDTRAHAGIVNYEPSELVVTARCGTPLAELESLLSQHGQMLGFEPPDFSGQATIGGCVAAGLAGPARMAAGFRHGGVRDAVLGATLLDGRGQLLRFGGTVLKNVAGYDVSRLLAGSLGGLGVIAEVSLKVLPVPFSTMTLCFEAGEPTALQMCDRWRGQPLPVTATSWCDGRLHLRLGGAAAAVQAAAAELGGERLHDDAARDWWSNLRHQSHPFFTGAGVGAGADAGALWRLSLPAAAPPLQLGAAQLHEWHGMQRWLRSTADAVAIRTRVAELGGHATLFRRAAAAPSAAPLPAFALLPPAMLALQRRLRAVFDPHGIFDFGRLVTES